MLNQAVQSPKKRSGAMRVRRVSLEGTGDKARKHERTQVKIQLVLPGGSRLGPGKVALLEHIDVEGSLYAAAASMQMSYGHAWHLMSQINTAFDTPAVSTPDKGQGGRAAQLTDFGRELIRNFRALEAEVRRNSKTRIEWLESHRAPETTND